MKENLNIINAQEKHSRLIWEWRNDLTTRKMFKSQEFISWEEHSRWFNKAILNKDFLILLGIYRESPFGVTRFELIDKLNKYFQISINIAPKQRGKGMGKIMLIKSIDLLRDYYPDTKKIIAEVKKENIASNKMFLKASFVNDEIPNREFNSYSLLFS